MPFLRHILRHRHVDLTHFVPIYVEHEQIGWTKTDFAKLLGQFDFAWIFSQDRLTLNPNLVGFEQISQTIHDVFLEISAQGHFPVLPDYSAIGGDDWLPVGQERWTNPLLRVHRFYSTCLGIRRESVMLHAYEEDKMWLAVRGAGVEDDVGRYDMVASGCMVMGQTVQEALLHEGEEECGLSQKYMTDVKSGAELHTMYHTSAGFILDEIFHVFDMNTQNGFQPKVVSSREVSHFELLPISEVIELVEKSNRIKPQIAYILVDFLIRHGYLKSDTPSYTKIIDELSNPYLVAA